MGVEWENLDSFKKKLIQLENRVDSEIETLLNTLAQRFIGIAKLNTAVDTGNLRRSWFIGDIETEGDTFFITVGNNAKYAADVEFGHKQKRRWVPGVWEGSRFKYNPDVKTGMMLQTKFVKGHFMFKISLSQLNKELTPTMKKWFDSEIKKWWEK